MWQTYKIMRKMATGNGANKEIIDLRKYSNGSNWKNTNICVGISSINVSKDTTKIVASYDKIDDNTFKIISYTDNIIYENKVEDSQQLSVGSGDNKSITKQYIGNYFYITSYIGCYSWSDGAKANGSMNYRILENGVWSGWVTLVSHANSGHSADNFRKRDLILEKDTKITIEIQLNSGCNRKGSASASYSITGGTKLTGQLLDGTLEWLAYEN